ncbi:hypothetical protein MOBT1_001397 [Malassezia obtusa]|uniref:MYND-type domain-containing protein n=1 Tax=Malassezia obtusa TaxID=76774 RepID=A0AAF0E417_9BASI|nr:hypothetical protein MOBT1_001397 [Malassezia obtusa]
MDGGLERLVHILRTSPRRLPNQVRDMSVYHELHANWKWSLAFQCVVNIGVRGSEAIRTRVVEAGMAPIIVRVLESFLVAADMQKDELARRSQAEPPHPRRSVYPDAAQSAASTRAAAPSATPAAVPARPATPMEMDTLTASGAPDAETDTGLAEGSTSSYWTGVSASASASASECAEDTEMYTEEDQEAEVDKREALQATPRAPARAPPAQQDGRASLSSPPPTRVDGLDAARTPRAHGPRVPTERESRADAPGVPDAVPSPPSPPSLVYREEEVLMSLQLLAYLSKYPHVRLFFHNADVRDDMLFCPDWPEDTMPNRSWEPSDPVKRNVFSVAERFTLRSSRSSGSTGALNSFFPRLGHEIQYWAGVVMRNACRKDESRGGIRQCANMLCGKWESYPREFAKCRRCRKAKYCSKQCQSKGWQMGHRFWCSARDDADGRDWKKKEPASRTASASGAEADAEAERSAPDARAVGAVAQPAPPAAPAAVPAAAPAAPAAPASHYTRPLGARAVPTTLARADSQTLPQMRGVSAASIETLDPDATESAPGTEPPSDAPSPALAPRVGAPFPVHTLPPPIIAGSLNVHEGDPTTTTLRDHEVQDVQEHGVLEAIASSWPPPGRSPAPPSPAAPAEAADFDLGIHMPNSPVLLGTSPGGGSGGVGDAGAAAAAYGTRRVSALTSWNMARQLSLRNRHRAARAVSTSLLSDTLPAPDLGAMDTGEEPARLSATNLRSHEAYTSPEAPAAPAYVWAQPVHARAAHEAPDAGPGPSGTTW